MKRVVILTIATLLFVFQFAGLVMSNELTDDYFDIAKNYADANNFAKALEYLNEILKIEPQNSQALQFKNQIAPNSNTPDEFKTNAAETIKVLSVIPTKPSNVAITSVPSANANTNTDKNTYNSEYYNKKGLELYKEEKYAQAVDFFIKSIRLNTKNYQAYNNLGMAYFAQNNIETAVKFLKKSNSIKHEYTQPLVNLAMIYKKQSDEKSLVACLERAVEYNPSDYRAYSMLGEFYRGKCIYPLAISNYKKALDINPKYSNASFGLGLAYFDTEDFNLAAAAFSQFIEQNQGSDAAYYMLSKCFTAMGKYDYAQNAIQKAIFIKDGQNYEYDLAKIKYALQDYKGASAILSDLLVSTNNAEYFNYLGLCNYKMQNNDAAIANFNQAIQLDGLHPIYYYNLAQCYKSIGDKKNYAKYVNTATKINPVNYQDYIDLSYIYVDNGNNKFAINTLNIAISKFPDVKALYLSKLKIYETLGDDLNYNATKDEINAKFNSIGEKTKAKTK